jgi:hypothetical protein
MVSSRIDQRQQQRHQPMVFDTSKIPQSPPTIVSATLYSRDRKLQLERTHIISSEIESNEPAAEFAQFTSRPEITGPSRKIFGPAF